MPGRPPRSFQSQHMDTPEAPTDPISRSMKERVGKRVLDCILVSAPLDRLLKRMFRRVGRDLAFLTALEPRRSRTASHQTLKETS